jgi:hypothetical protein
MTTTIVTLVIIALLVAVSFNFKVARTQYATLLRRLADKISPP